MTTDDDLPDLPLNPTPEQRAEYIMMRLEQFIREGRTIGEGMSFKQWQAMAKTEIAIAVAAAQNEVQKDDPVTRRLLFMTAACLTTIGFWGTAVSLHKTAYLVGALVCGGAGLLLIAIAGEWRFRKWKRKKDAELRIERLANIEALNKRIKGLERALEKEEKMLEKKLKKTRKAVDDLHAAEAAVPPVPFEAS
ncbi:MAG TPA: hypothetical protein DCG48_07785 [Rhodospirillaceae bacterium]|nr:hypothetical protein [Rhodospirillaceae bacterium]